MGKHHVARFGTVYLDIDTESAMAGRPGNALAEGDAATLALKMGTSISSLNASVTTYAIPATPVDASDSHPDIVKSFKPRPMVLADTGAGRTVVPDLSLAINNYVPANDTAVSTANGVTKPKYMCDIKMRVEANHPDGTIHGTTINIYARQLCTRSAPTCSSR